jgi:hypothetical protein
MARILTGIRAQAGIFRSNGERFLGLSRNWPGCYPSAVIAIETLRDEVSRLPLEDRAAFAAFVLETLPPPEYCVSDEEVQRRWNEMESGAVTGISMEELFSRVKGGAE